MKIYLAGTFTTREKIRPIADALWRQGHEITSSWLNEVSKPLRMDQGTFWKKLAIKDLTEIKSSDLVVVFVDGISGGKNVELGYALGQHQSKEIWTVGFANNVFHTLADKNFANGDAMLKEAKKYVD